MSKLLRISKQLLVLAGDTTPSKGVDYTGDKVTKKVTPLSSLQENKDSLVLLLQTLPAKAPIKETIEMLASSAISVPEYLIKISSQLNDLLQPSLDTKEIAKIKATSGLTDLVSLLENYSREFQDLKEITDLLSVAASKHSDQDKNKPIRHTLRRKEEIKSPKPELDPKESIDLEKLLMPKDTTNPGSSE